MFNNNYLKEVFMNNQKKLIKLKKEEKNYLQFY